MIELCGSDVLIIELPVALPTWNRVLAMHPQERKKLRHLMHLFVQLAVDKQSPSQLELAEYGALIRPSKSSKELAKRLRKQTRKQAKRWELIAENNLAKAYFSPMVSHQVTIDLCSYRKRLVDVDGVSAKSLIDGLVNSRVIEDDSVSFVECVTYRQVKAKSESTVVTLERAHY